MDIVYLIISKKEEKKVNTFFGWNFSTLLYYEII